MRPSCFLRVLTNLLSSVARLRVGQGKVAKSSQEISYASIVEHLVDDLLSSLYLPDWPAAAMLLSWFCRIFTSCLEDNKSSPDTKGVALDHLGTIAARLRLSQLKSESMRSKGDAQGETRPRSLKAFAEIVASKDSSMLQDINNAYTSILDHLARAESDDQASESATEFMLAQWGSEIAFALKRASDALDQAKEDELPARDVAPLQNIISDLEAALVDVSAEKRSPGNVFDVR